MLCSIAELTRRGKADIIVLERIIGGEFLEKDKKNN